MKVRFIFPAITAAALLVGCTTHRQTATLVGPGTKRVYTATYDQAWRATLEAMRRSNLAAVTTDRTVGYMEARRNVYPHSRDERVGVWVRSIAPTQTEVEVVDRQAGPPMLAMVDREIQIQNDIALNLTHETPAVGTAPRDVIIERGSGTTIVVPERRDTVIVPSTTPTHEALREEQRQVEALRLRQQTGERALANEVDETKRDMLRREVERLRDDIRRQEDRLRDLERELR